jgi:hypothetical protein
LIISIGEVQNRSTEKWTLGNVTKMASTCKYINIRIELIELYTLLQEKVIFMRLSYMYIEFCKMQPTPEFGTKPL